MRKIVCFILGFVFFLTTGSESLFAQRGSARAETLEVRLASPLPRSSPWGGTLDRIAAEWARITDNEVRLRVIHDGLEGSEEKMRQSLRTNNIQAAIFTSFGLTQINPAIMTVSTPFLIRNDAELNVVMREIQGDLESRLNRGEYFVLAFSKSGFVNVFSKEPVFTPDDLKRLRIASNAEASRMNAAFVAMGFQVVDTDMTDVGAKINAGAVGAIYQNPAAIAALRLQGQLPNMLSINIAPVLGGIVINQVTWRRIGELNPRYQNELLRATRRIAEEFDASLPRTMDNAVQTMSRTGLKVNRPTPAQEQLWYSEINRVIPQLLGSTFDRDLYNRINSILTRHRGR